MKYFWVVFNLALFALALRGGYVSLNPARLSHTNPGPILCLIVVLITPIFTILITTYSIQRWKQRQLLRPSLDRNPLMWWRDPLQALFVSTCIMIAFALGGSIRQPSVGSVGFWTIGVYASFGVGLFIGQIVVYRIHGQHIASN